MFSKIDILSTPVCSSKVLREVTEVAFASARLTVGTTRIVVSIDLLRRTLLSLDLRCEQFELCDNRRDISLENRRKGIGTITIT